MKKYTRADLPPEFYAWENRDNFAECGAALLTLWCGDKWKNLREFGPGDPFDFRAVPVEYRPFEKNGCTIRARAGDLWEARATM